MLGEKIFFKEYNTARKFSSLYCFSFNFPLYSKRTFNGAGVAELADALALGASGATCESSSLSSGTNQ